MYYSKRLALLMPLAIAGCIDPAGHNRNSRVIIPPELAETAIPVLPVNTTYATIPVSINGEKPYRFIMDTGANFTILFSSPAVERLGLSTSRSFGVGGSGEGERAKAKLAKGFQLDVAGVKMLDRQAVYFPWQNIPFFSSPETVFWDGVLGHDFYTRFAVDVDLIADAVHLYPAGQVINDIGVNAVHLPLTIHDLSSYVEASVQTVEGGPFVDVKLHLDTGASNGLALLKDKYPSFKPSTDSKPGQTVGVQGTAATYPSRIKTLRLGSLELKDIKMTYREQAGSSFNDGEAGRIGAGLLARFRYIVNYPGRELILIPRADSLQADQRLPRTGLSYYAFGADFDRLVVTNALYGAKRAGIKPGDIITSIGGQSAYDIARSGLKRFLATKAPGEEVEVCLVVNDQTSCHEFPLESE